MQTTLDNLQHATGNIIGLTVLRPLRLRFGKDQRGLRFFSTVAANMAADGIVVWFPYKG